jgi:hypothetical protein
MVSSELADHLVANVADNGSFDGSAPAAGISTEIDNQGPNELCGKVVAFRSPCGRVRRHAVNAGEQPDLRPHSGLSGRGCARNTERERLQRPARIGLPTDCCPVPARQWPSLAGRKGEQTVFCVSKALKGGLLRGFGCLQLRQQPGPRIWACDARCPIVWLNCHGRTTWLAIGRQSTQALADQEGFLRALLFFCL